MPLFYRIQRTGTRQREVNRFKTFGMQRMCLKLGGSLEPLLPCSIAGSCSSALCVCEKVCVCVFRILNSKGWGLIMEPDSSSPASICLTVPPIFPSIPSLPLFPASQFLICCVCDPPLYYLPPALSLSLSASLLLLSLFLRALGPSGSCEGSRRARCCHRRRHR